MDQVIPPSKVNKLCEALWYDAKGDWDTAHQIAQSIRSHYGSWVHAYLHRKEGDLTNAAYWYYQAGKKMPKKSLEEEWNEIAKEAVKTCYNSI